MKPPLMLEIQTGKYKGRKVKLSGAELIAGRGEEAKLRIASSEVSRQHCVLVPQADGVLVRDLGSRNGTFVDGRPVTGERLLQPGGTLTIGPMTFLLLGEKPAAPAKPKVDPTEKLSDDDIASWLTDEIPLSSQSIDTLKSDTSIMSKDDFANPPAAPEPAPAPKKREFKTIAEEAQDIIRRHYEMTSGDQAAAEI